MLKILMSAFTCSLNCDGRLRSSLGNSDSYLIKMRPGIGRFAGFSAWSGERAISLDQAKIEGELNTYN
jgi:hypothetical protein